MAVRELGGSGSIDEIVNTVLEREQYSSQQIDELHNDGPQTEIEFRLAWARSWLKGMGLLTNSDRAVWSLTENGRVAEEQDLPELRRQYTTNMREARKAKKEAQEHDLVDPDESSEIDVEDRDWRETPLDLLMAMSPSAFERLAQRLLREAGFLSATVTGRSGDGGIDGQGVYRMSLLSFPVFFQCKRYQGSVGSSVVRDFRGAMAGRGDKGLLITTGTFTKDAKSEANRDGAPPIDLIDGQRLCDLLKDYDLGVTTMIRQVEDVVVEPEFFSTL